MLGDGRYVQMTEDMVTVTPAWPRPHSPCPPDSACPPRTRTGSPARTGRRGSTWAVSKKSLNKVVKKV